MLSTLVVVDMQECFEAACYPSVIIGVTQEIVLARQKRSPIILLEYEGCGKSHEGFSSLLRNYPWKARIRKGDDDGSNEIIRVIRRRGFNNSTLRLCGVNSDCCVYATVEGLLKRLEDTKIEVVKEACGCEYGFDWRNYFRHPNLKLV